MTRELTSEEIERLASPAGLRRIAVENFLGTLDLSIGQSGNRRNLYQDAVSYHWNAKTVAAIELGIQWAFKVNGAKRVA